jgi:putative OPT family oligopeptide transporter
MAPPTARPKATVTKSGAKPAAKGTGRSLPIAADAPPQPKGPYIPASKVFPEMTARALVLGIILSVILGAANMYVGLRAGLTVSATIPAAVMTMAILRFFKDRNILENTIGMTTASAGEALGAGLIFTIPAFILTGVWTEIRIWETVALGLVGGTLGVLFTVPLRRALVVEAKLPYPEGIATAQVLVAGEQGGKGARILGGGMLIGASVAMAGLGMRLWQEAAQGAVRIANSAGYLATSLSPILMAVGYIVGLRIASLIMIGGVLGFLIFAPLLLAVNYPTPGVVLPSVESDPQGALLGMWRANVRLIGAGAMITGGLFTLYKIRDSLRKATAEARTAFQNRGQAETRLRTEQDIPIGQVIVGIALLALPVAGVAYLFTGSVLYAAFGMVAAAIFGFFFSSVAGYLAGVVGSSNNPISGVTIVTLLFTSFGLIALGATGAAGILAALSVAAIICTGAAIAGDNLQDLKSGYLIGSTPRRQQVGLIVGVAAMALAAPFVLNAIQETFELGSNQFPAPQAFVVTTLVQSIFGGTVNVPMLVGGVVLGAILIAARLPVLPVAVGIYLPFTLSTPIFIGGVLRWAAERMVQKRAAARNLPQAETKKHMASLESTGVLFSSGLIAGEALMGIGIILILFSTGETSIPGWTAPLVYGILGMGTALIFADRWSGAVRWGLAGGALLIGAAFAGAIFTGALHYEPAEEGAVFWPGLLIFAYVGVLMVYLPIRNLLLGKEPEEAPGVGLEGGH